MNGHGADAVAYLPENEYNRDYDFIPEGKRGSRLHCNISARACVMIRSDALRNR